MADVFNKEKRSEVMSKIRSKNTRVEKLVFRELGKRKIYFMKHYKGAEGRPDIALPNKKKAIFIDGDFWHGYNFKKTKRRLPKVYWVKKIGDNIKRDKTNRNKLRRNGWKVLRVWGHEIEKDLDKTIKKITKFLN